MTTEKLILDLCAGSGAWSKPYAEHGYRVELVTLPDRDLRTYVPPTIQVHGVLAAPPCEKFSQASHRQEPDWRRRDVTASLELILACLRIIWTVKPEWWALENPVGYLNRFLGRPPYCFRACDFGDPWEKRTYLWGFFNEPQRLSVKPTDPLHTTRAKVSDVHDSIARAIVGRPARRAVTPKGFAEAFFLANP